MSPGIRLRPVTPVAILGSVLQQLLTEVRATDRFDPGWSARLGYAHELAAGLDPYLSRSTSPASPALCRLAERSEVHDWSGPDSDATTPGLEAEMLSGHVEGQLLRFLVHVTGARRVLEIGMFSGYSALAMAEGLPEDGEVVTCEIDPAVARFAQRCFDASPCGSRISVRVGDAADTLRDLDRTSESFDLVFIDADKGSYGDYLDLVLDGGLLAEGGVICVDNTLMQGQPYLGGAGSANGDSIAEFNLKVAQDQRLDQVLLPVRDGMTLIRRA